MHKVMMTDLVKGTGTFRSKDVGVYAGTESIHVGIPPRYVSDLMYELYTWKLHLLIKSFFSLRI